MAPLLQVALGGACGAICRYWAVRSAERLFGAGFPLGVLIANILGSFLIGIAFAVLVEKSGNEWHRFSPLIMTGFLGGFTTFSAFSLDNMVLFEQGRYGIMGLYMGLSVGLSLLALGLGLQLTRALLI